MPKPNLSLWLPSPGCCPCIRQVETTCLFPSSEEEPLILLFWNSACFCWGQDYPELAIPGGVWSPCPGFPLKTSIHCFVCRPGAALRRNVRSRCDNWPSRLQLVFWVARLVWFPCFGHRDFLHSCYFLNWGNLKKNHVISFCLHIFGFTVFQVESQNVRAGKRII